MKIIAELNDMNIIGRPGISDAKPRRTARAVLRRSDGLYAVMYMRKYDFHILPGGGIDEGESIEDALRREVLEETGCRCVSIRPIGAVSENRAHADYTQISYYFAVETDAVSVAPAYTEEEIGNGSELQWHPLAEVIRLIGEPQHEVIQRKYLQARDLAALKEYEKSDA